MSKTYYVRIPIMGVLGFSVTADSEEEAQDRAERTCWKVGAAQLDPKFHDTDSPALEVQLEELDTYHRIVEGNVFYGPLGEIEVSEEWSSLSI